MTLEAYETPVSQMISEVAKQLDISVIVPDGLATMKMTAKYDQSPGQRVIEDIGDYINKIPEFDGGTLRFLDESKAVHEFLVMRSGYKPSAELVDDLQGLLGPDARIRAVDDRVVVSGTRRDLQQVQRFQRHLETGPDGWRLNIRVVAVTETFRRDLGLDWDISARLALNAGSVASFTDTELVVQMIAEATQTQADAVLHDNATMYILEGSSSEINQGRQVPIPRFQTSPEGTTTVVGYDYINAGFNLKASAERVPVGVRLNLEPSISNVVGFVRDAPITEESSVRADVILENNEWVIITGLSTEQTSSDHKGIPGLSKNFGTENRISDKSSLLIMVQAQRIFGRDP